MTYQVCRSENVLEDLFAFHDFHGNKPALPPLTCESVESIFYVVEEEQTRN